MGFSQLVVDVSARTAAEARARDAALDLQPLAAREIPATVDFETEEIRPRPDYPPKPVGVAIWEPGREPEYLAWGHPTKNNTTKERAVRRLAGVWRRYPILSHTAFDVDVAIDQLGFAPPPRGWHNTEYLAFLETPHAIALKLKILADVILGIPNDEQRDLNAWIKANVEGASRLGDDKLGALISKAPGDVVAPYAIGDVRRTRLLFEHLYPRIRARDMLPAYQRELDLMPVLKRNEAEGLRIDADRLRADAKGTGEAAHWERDLETIDDWMRRRLRAPDLDLDKRERLADALERAGVITAWKLTPKGRRSTRKEDLPEIMTDAVLLDVMTYRNRLANVLRTFVAPWLAQLDRTGDRIHTNWNQVRGESAKGARTGRLTSNPNFQNLLKVPTPMRAAKRGDRGRTIAIDPERVLAMPPDLLATLGPPPHLRDYVLPDRGQVILQRDYAQQELRVLAHYEGSTLLAAYLADPKMDVHENARRRINQLLGTTFERKPVKNTGFGIIYGMGVGKLARQIGAEVKIASTLKKTYLTVFPGLRAMDLEFKRRVRENLPIRTWGGRLYYVEPPRQRDDGTWQTFDYKLLNVLIQASSADITKTAILNYERSKRDGRTMITVHDEILVSAPPRAVRSEMRILREAMEAVELDLPLPSDGSTGPTFGRLERYIDD